MMTKPYAFHDLPASAFPFTVSAYRVDTGECVWSHTVKEGPTILDVPPLKQQFGVAVRIVIQFADGSRTEAPPP